MSKLIEVLQPTQTAADVVLHVPASTSSNASAEYDRLQYAAGFRYPILKVRSTTFTEPHIGYFAFKVGFKFIPDIVFTIIDDASLFQHTDYPIENDIVTLFAGNQYDTESRPIHLDFKILKVHTNKSAKEKSAQLHTFSAQLAIMKANENMHIAENSTTLDIIKKLCTEMGLGLVTNITSTNDKTIYRQYSMTNLDFLMTLSSKLYIDDDTIMHCFIDQHYRLNIIDVKANLDNEPPKIVINKDIVFFNDLEQAEDLVFTNDIHSNDSTQFVFTNAVPSNSKTAVQQTAKPIESTVVKKDYASGKITSTVKNSNLRTSTKSKKDVISNNATEVVPVQTISVDGESNADVKQLDSVANNTKLQYLLNNSSLTVDMLRFSNMLHIHQLIDVKYYNSIHTVATPLKSSDTNLDSTYEPPSESLTQTINDQFSGKYTISGMYLIYTKNKPLTQSFKLVRREWNAQKYEPEEIDLSDTMYGAPEPYTMPDPPPTPPLESGDGNYNYSNSLGNWIQVAKGELGVKEYAGGSHNPRIQDYHKIGGGLGSGIADEVPWCGSFVGWCMTKAGYPTAKGSASAISWASYGVACAPGTIGAIIVLKSSDRTSTTSGNHVAFCLGTRGDRTLTLGGNQSGNAVTESSVSTSKIFAWRMPPGGPSNSVASGAASVAATGPYRISQQGINFIKNNEGCKLQAYQDSVGVWTIGYGHTKTVRPGMTISYAQAEALLRQDITFFENSVNSNAKVKLTQSMFDALVSFIYNLGPGKFSRTSTVGSLVNNRQYMPAANSILQYNKAKGKVLAGLTKRRQGERAMFLSQGSNPV